MASSADLVARAPLYPAPDVVAYLDRIEADVYARAGAYGSPDVVAYPWGALALVPTSSPVAYTYTPDPGAMTIGQGAAPSIGGAAWGDTPGDGFFLLLL